MCARVRKCVHVCACARVCLMRMHHFQDSHYLLNYTTLIYLLNRQNFRYVGLFSSVLCACDVAACGVIDRVIQIAIVDRHLSEGVRGTLLLGSDSF